MPSCRSCRAPVIWAVSVTGKSIPLDPHPIDGGNIELRDGVAHVVAPVAGRVRYVSHFAKCPQARQHRRAKA